MKTSANVDNRIPKRLGVNIDHVATLRQTRKTFYPDPLQAARIAVAAGADGITVHLREDRRHIQDSDVFAIREKVPCHLNFEMALNQEMLRIALILKPDYCCLVPEKREELTTEGGLNVSGLKVDVKKACQQLAEQGIPVSLFIEAEKAQIDAAKEAGATAIELHTGRYAELLNVAEQEAELAKIAEQARYAQSIGLIVNAGHGLHYHNVQRIVAIPELYELNIGHSIIAQAVFVGLEKAVADMKALMG